MSGHRRYPGSSSFQDEELDRLLFWGREQEKSALFHLILAENLVLFYAKSGCGKTSLLNAGIFQQLRDKEYYPLLIRLNDLDQDPIRSILDQVLAHEARGIEIEQHENGYDHLWRFFSGLRLWRGNVLLTPVVVFDQFEELFTINTEERRQRFLEQFSDLTRRQVPETVDPEGTTDASVRSPAPKIVLSMREDYLGEVEHVAAHVPRVMAHRFRLTPLTREQAQEAIRKPAEFHDERISGPRFSYSPEAIDELLDFLCTQRQRGRLVTGDEIEPFQLQILCRHIEDHILKLQGSNGIVNAADLGGTAGMQTILRGFYTSKLEEFTPEDRETVRRLCEQGLISKTDKRLSLEEEEIERQFGVGKALLVRLVEQRLLRVDPRVGSLYYELTHDTLVAPILMARQERDPDAMVRMAASHGLEGRFANAFDCYERAVALDPKNTVAYVSWAALLLHLGRLEDADEVLLKAARQGVEHEGIYHQLGRVAAAKGNYAGAIEQYEKALRLNNQLAAVHTDLGTACRKTGQTELAAKAYARSVELDPNSASNWRELALLWIEDGRHEQAIDTYKKAVRANPQFGYIFEELVSALVRRKQTTVACEMCRLALGVDSGDSDYFAKVGMSLFELKAREDAIEAFQKATALKPHARAYLYWGICLLALERTEQAQPMVTRAVELDPVQVLPEIAAILMDTDVPAEQILGMFRNAEAAGPLNASNYAVYGRALLKFGRFDEALDKYEKALQTESENIAALTGRGAVLMVLKRVEESVATFERAAAVDGQNATIFYVWGTALSTCDRHEEALAKLERAVDLDPTKPAYLQNWGDAFFALGRHEEAIDKYEKAAALDPTIKVFHKWGDSLLALTRYPQAIEKYQQAAEHEPSNAKICSQWGIALMSLKREGEALEQFQRAITLSPKDGFTHYLAGTALQSLGRWEEALGEAERVIELAPDSQVGYQTAGFDLLELHRYEEAAQRYEKAATLSENDTSIHFGCGKALFSLGKYEEAIPKYERAIELDPSSATAYVGLGLTLDKLGRHEKADRAFAKAEETCADEALCDVGFYFFVGGKYEKAVDFSRRALEHEPDLFQARANLALALLHLGRIEESRREYGQALVLAGKKGGRATVEWAVLADLRAAVERNPSLANGQQVLDSLLELSATRFPAHPGVADRASSY
jgi:tetratricopeptide (TPR) repeat protein